MDEVKFVPGLYAKPPHPNAPDFVKCSISIKRSEFVEWVNNWAGEWVNIDVKESRNGKWYAAINEWKPKSNTSTENVLPPGPSNQESTEMDFDDEIPF